jgi:hypothetical protein
MMATRERGRASRKGKDVSGMSDRELRSQRENRRAGRAAAALSIAGGIGAGIAGGRNVKQ